MWLRTFGGLLLAIVLAAGLALYFAPTYHHQPSKKAVAKMDLMAVAAAVRAYNTEYGKYPGLDRKTPFLDADSNAFLMRILRGLDTARNPRKTVFFSARELKQEGLFTDSSVGGLNLKTGALIDPWGNPYRIAIDADYDNVVANPYSDDPPIQTVVIAWSLGKDGQQGSPANPHTYKDSDDIVSWQ